MCVCVCVVCETTRATYSMSGVGLWSGVVPVLCLLVAGVPISRADNNCTESCGTDSGTTTKTVVVIAVPCVTLSVILVAVAVSGSVAVRQMHRRASGPVYLGSCRRINTIHTETVNEGIQALERAREQSTYSNHTSPSTYREREDQEEEVERGGRRLDREGVGHQTSRSTAAFSELVGRQRETNTGSYRNSNKVHNSYGGLTCVLSLSNTYTCPDVQTPPPRDIGFSTGSSTPCLSASYFQPLPEDNQTVREEDEEKEGTCPPLQVVVHESPRYMHLTPITMEEPSHYESLAKATTKRSGRGRRREERDDGVGNGLKSRQNSEEASTEVDSRERQVPARQAEVRGASLPLSTERGSVVDSGQTLSQSSAARSSHT